jgi:hypothetical protein
MSDETPIPDVDLQTRAMLLALPQDVADMLRMMFARWGRVGPDVVADARDICDVYLEDAGPDDRFKPFVHDLYGVLKAWTIHNPPSPSWRSEIND